MKQLEKIAKIIYGKRIQIQNGRSHNRIFYLTLDILEVRVEEEIIFCTFSISDGYFFFRDQDHKPIYTLNYSFIVNCLVDLLEKRYAPYCPVEFGVLYRTRRVLADDFKKLRKMDQKRSNQQQGDL